MKEKFDRKKYSSHRYVMHCSNDMEFKLFLQYLDSIGERWHETEPYVPLSYLYRIHETETVLYFNNGDAGISSRDTAANNGYIVLEFSDFDFHNERSKFKFCDALKRIFHIKY